MVLVLTMELKNKISTSSSSLWARVAPQKVNKENLWKSSYFTKEPEVVPEISEKLNNLKNSQNVRIFQKIRILQEPLGGFRPFGSRLYFSKIRP